MDIERLLVLLAGMGIDFVASHSNGRIHVIANGDMILAAQAKMGKPIRHDGFNMALLKGNRVEFISVLHFWQWDAHQPLIWQLGELKPDTSYQLLYYYMRSLEATAPEPEPEVDYTRIQVVNNTYQHKRPGSKRREREQRKLAYQTKGAR